jgi:hypothetical protein
LLYVIDWDFLSSQFTAYRVVCEGVVVGNECSQPGMALDALTYRVLVDQKSVILEGVKGYPPTTYAKCAITSRTDWKCSYDDGSGQFGATKVVFFMKPASNDWIEHDIFVSRWKYLAIKSGLWPLFIKAPYRTQRSAS